jgi:fatty-acyl-CoA synthase
LLDDAGDPVPAGACGRIFVGNAAQFEGYAGGGTKQRVGGLMSSGDLGHFDKAGRLFIDGRADDMLVNGGENVARRGGGVAHRASGGSRGGRRRNAGRAVRTAAARSSCGKGRRLSEDALGQHVKANLARYKAPRDVVFLDALPRNPTGKVLPRVLAEHGAGIR